jgi:hypothetical protein
MSRGPGRVEQAVITGMRERRLTRTAAIAAAVYGVEERLLSTAQLVSVRRALRRLAARGEIIEQPPVKESAWRLPRTTKRNIATPNH